MDAGTKTGTRATLRIPMGRWGRRTIGGRRGHRAREATTGAVDEGGQGLDVGRRRGRWVMSWLDRTSHEAVGRVTRLPGHFFAMGVRSRGFRARTIGARVSLGRLGALPRRAGCLGAGAPGVTSHAEADPDETHPQEPSHAPLDARRKRRFSEGRRFSTQTRMRRATTLSPTFQGSRGSECDVRRRSACESTGADLLPHHSPWLPLSASE